MKKITLFLTTILGLFCVFAIFDVVFASSFTQTVPQDSSTGSQAPATSSLAGNVCQTKQETIQIRSFALAKTMDNILAEFDLIDSRVRTYYTGKVVPSGKKVPNYEVLTADIDSKKKAAEADLITANTKMAAFDCGSENPKDQLTQFRISAQMVKKDLQEYRTAIKNLIVAIHAAK